MILIHELLAAAHVVGPVYWVLLPLSIMVLASLLLTIAARMKTCPAPPPALHVFLDWAKDGAVLIGLAGNLIVLSSLAESGGFDSVELASRKIFGLLSTGFKGSTFGVIISVMADVCIRLQRKD